MQRHFKKWGFAYFFLGFAFGFLIFFRLGHFSLWQDEADLTLLSQSVLQTGWPIARMGEKFLTQWAGSESTSHYLWFFDPWPLFYLRAISLKVFGISEWAARFPFALLGWLSLIPLGLLTFRWTKNHAATWLTLFFFSFNPWVLLYIRQSKYWPVVFFSYGLMLLGYQKWEEGKKGGLLFALGLTLLFHSNYFTAALSLAGLGIYTLFFADGALAKRRFILTTSIVLVLFCLPFFLIGSFENRVTTMSQWPTLAQYFKKLGTHIFYFNRQICPLVLVFLWISWWRRRQWGLLGRQPTRLILSCILVAWMGIALLNFDVLRFNLELIPLFCILMGTTIKALYEKNKALGLLAFSVLWGTNLFQMLPETIQQVIQSPSAFSVKKNILKEEWWALKNYYLKEYSDPAKIIPKMLLPLWKPGEYAYLNHNQTVWQFYSDIPLAYLTTPDKLLSKDPPPLKQWADKGAISWWIGPHRVGLARGPYLSEEEMIEEWRKAGYRYEVIDTKIPVLNWDLNSPIRYKHFLEKFAAGDNPLAKGTIRLVHKIR